MLLSIDKGDVPWSDNNSQELIPEIEQKLSIRLADNQKEAIIKALSKRLTVITGGPGTGKTTLVKALLKLLELKKLNVKLCAPPVEPLNA
ncbi:RecD/TraA family helicase domain protein (plasmid) [Candidatus Megaera polyxenophila]|nr:RecD/TraA family helicase domain protein [Candidatus Megaera polyxenophila]